MPRTIGTIAAADAIETHTKRMGIEGDMSTQLWHLVLSLREWCKHTDVSFDECLSDTKRHMDEFAEDF